MQISRSTWNRAQLFFFGFWVEPFSLLATSYRILNPSRFCWHQRNSRTVTTLRIYFFQSTQHWIKWLSGWLILGILKNLSAATSYIKYFVIIIENTGGFCIFNRDLCYGQRCWGPGALNQGERSGACFTYTATPSLSIYTHVLVKIRLLWSKQHRHHALKSLLQTPFIFKTRC